VGSEFGRHQQSAAADVLSTGHEKFSHQEPTMNTMTISTCLRRVIASAMLGALASGFTAVATADSTDAHSAIVKYGDLDASTPRGAAVLYGRIRRSAESVCWRSDGDDYANYSDMKTCIHNAIAGGVIRINQPALFAVYNAKNKTQLPVILAAGPSH
jgi:UrcA family protein